MATPPQLHGPYYEWSYKVAGKTRTRRLRRSRPSYARPGSTTTRRSSASCARWSDSPSRKPIVPSARYRRVELRNVSLVLSGQGVGSIRAPLERARGLLPFRSPSRASGVTSRGTSAGTTPSVPIRRSGTGRRTRSSVIGESSRADGSRRAGSTSGCFPATGDSRSSGCAPRRNPFFQIRVTRCEARGLPSLPAFQRSIRARPGLGRVPSAAPASKVTLGRYPHGHDPPSTPPLGESVSPVKSRPAFERTRQPLLPRRCSQNRRGPLPVIVRVPKIRPSSPRTRPRSFGRSGIKGHAGPLSCHNEVRSGAFVLSRHRPEGYSKDFLSS